MPEPKESKRASSWRLPPLLWVVLLVGLTAALGRTLNAALAASEFTVVDCARSRWLVDDAWADPLWEEMLAERLAWLGPVDTDDPDRLELVRETLASLPFVARVHRLEVLWPDGLRVSVDLREPVACVPVDDIYLVVDREGIVLPGPWPEIPGWGAGRLPVVGPFDGELDGILPGERVPESCLAGISVAASLYLHLDADALAALGPVAIDASRAHLASPTEPGTRLHLEGGRTVLFGRAPNCGEPGERPVEQKWSSLRAALALLSPVDSGEPTRDWDVLDVRWDRPELHLRPTPALLAGR